MTTKEKKPTENRMRFAVYARYSSEMQNELSINDQFTCCRKAVAERGGVIVGEFHDDAQSGWNLDREGLTELRAFAARKKCDAIIMWKFDRLMRDHNQTVVVKLLLRKEYGVKLYCVEGFSEDDDDSPYTAMMEQLLAVFSAFYSKNLSIDTKRAKRLRAERGEFNGSEAPIGYTLTIKSKATLDNPEGLHLEPRLAEIVRIAFQMYATGNYSDSQMAAWLNTHEEVRTHRSGLRPIDKEFVRNMLQNRVYLGEVSHSDTQYIGGLGQGRKGSRDRKEWFPGKHVAIIDENVFTECQSVRSNAAVRRQTPSKLRNYLLHDRVYCAHCIVHKPQGIADDRYGKMRPTFVHNRNQAYFRCMTGERGYDKCPQPYINETELNTQVVDFLTNLEIPEGYRERVEQAVRNKVEHAAAFKRMDEIRAIIERIDISWEHGFLDKADYIGKRKQLERELNTLQPLDYDELTEAADLITNFRSYWEKCQLQSDQATAQKQLLAKIVQRVFVFDLEVIAVVLHGNFAVVLDTNEKAPGDVSNALSDLLTQIYKPLPLVVVQGKGSTVKSG